MREVEEVMREGRDALKSGKTNGERLKRGKYHFLERSGFSRMRIA